MGKPLPVELLARVALPARCNIGMGKHTVWRDGMTRQNVEAESLDCLHLGSGEIGIVEVMAGIMDLDADRAGIEVCLPRPAALAGVPPLVRWSRFGDGHQNVASLLSGAAVIHLQRHCPA